MKQKQTPKEDQIYIQVSQDWLHALRHAYIPLANGERVKLGWLEPLVDSGAYRLMFVPVDLKDTELIGSSEVDGEMFSRN